MVAAAQESGNGRLAVTHRHEGNAQAAVVSLPDGILLFGSAASESAESDLPELETYAWQLSRNGNVLLMGRPSLVSISSDLIRRDLVSDEEIVIHPPVEGELIASTAQLTETGDTVIFQYRAKDATDHRNLKLGIWQAGSSQHLIGDASLGIAAFALSTQGVITYVALPLTEEAGATRVYMTDIAGSEPRQIATLPSDPPLAINPLTTQMTLSDDGDRVSISTSEASAALAPIRYRSFGIDVESGDVFEYSSIDANLGASSLSPDGAMVALFDADTRTIVLSPFDQPSERQSLTPPLEVYPDRGVVWSPDGNHIAYGGLADQGGLQVFTVGVDGSDPMQVTRFDEGLWNTSFSWGLNGR